VGKLLGDGFVFNQVIQYCMAQRFCQQSFQFKGKNQDIREIGKILDVTHILEGSVRKVGNRIRVSAQLNKTDDASHIWSDQYDRELTDVFKVQDDITQRIVKALKTEFLESGDLSSGTSNVEAYNSFLLGRFHQNRFEKMEAISFFEEAIELDQNYANAYGQLALAHLNLMATGLASPREKIPLFRELIEKCLSLDPDNPVGRYGMTFLIAYVDHDYQSAINESALLMLENPKDTHFMNGYGLLLGSLKKYDLAVRVYDHALTLDPLDFVCHFNRAGILITAGRYDKARDALEMAGKLGGKTGLWWAELARLEGDVDGLQAQLDRGPDYWNSEAVYAAYEAEVLFLKGDLAQTKVKLEALKQNASSQSSIYAIRIAMLEGDFELAVTLFEQAVSDSEPLTLLMAGPPAFTELRADPRFQDIVRKIGMDDESIAKLSIPLLPF